MSKKTARIALTAAAIAITSTLLAACSGQAPESGDQPDTITFLTWTGGDAGAKWQNLADSYEAETGVEVVIEVIPSDSYNQVVSARVEANNAPDLIEVQGGSLVSFADGGLLRDLSDESWVGDQLPAVQGIAESTGGKTFTLAGALQAQTVFYNVDIFDSLGVDVPSTWDDFLVAIDTFRAAEITPLAVGGKDMWTLQNQSMQMQANAQDGNDEYSELIEGTLAYSDSSWRQAMEAWVDLEARGAYDSEVLGIDWPSSANQFGGGGAAMMIQTSSALPAILEADPEINLSTFALPYPAEREPKAVASVASMLGVPSNAPNEAGALSFLGFMADNIQPFLEDAGAFSPFVGVSPAVQPALEAIAPLFEDGRVNSITLGLPEAINVAQGSGVQGLLARSMSVDEVLANMDREQQTR